MDAYSLIGFAAVAALLAYIVKQFDARMGLGVSLAALSILLLLALSTAGGAIETIKSIAEMGGISEGTLGLMLKAAGIACLTSFAAEFCRDLNENSLAMAAELLGRLILLGFALPLLNETAKKLIELADKLI